MNLMGGRIQVESQPNQGSTFSFTAKFASRADAEEATALPPNVDLANLNVLVVDDNATNRQIIMQSLENWKMSPVSAAGVREAQQILAPADGQEASFNLVLIDSDMPEANGFVLAQWIRDREAMDTNVIMMQTLASMRNQIDLKELGVKASLTKPFGSAELLQAILIALDLSEPQPETDTKELDQEMQPAFRPLKILVAEDTPFNQKFILRLLDRWGHQPVIAENGLKALDAISDKSFDLILMDVQMPEMDGFDATVAIRKLEKQTGRHTPIIAMTAHVMKGDRERCLEVGMDEYISKPINSDILFKTIQRLVPSEDFAPQPVEETVADESPAFDSEALLSAFDHDWEFFEEAVDMFVSDYPPMLEALQEAITSQDADTLRRNAHALKGMVGNFQGLDAAKAAAELEEMGRQKELDGADQAYAILIKKIDNLEKILMDLVKKGST